MKVMWWLSEFPPDPGGIGRLAHRIGPSLVERGVDVHHLVTWFGPSEEQSDGIPITRIPARDALLANKPAELLAVRRSIADTKRRVAPDLYHFHVCEPSPVLHIATQSAHPAPSVATLHNEVLGTIRGGGDGTLLGRLLDEATVITTVSTAAADDLVTWRPDLALKVMVVENGVDLGPPPPPLTVEPVIAAVGRLVPQKRIDRLVRALALLVDRVPGVRLVVAGDGPELPVLERLADELGVRERIAFVGHVSALGVRDVLESCRVMAAPSEWEGLPFALLEAAERGRPMVATAVGGSARVVVDGVTGLTLDNSRIDEEPTLLADALERVLLEPGLAERLGAAARERVGSHFSVDRCVDAYEAVYRRIVCDRPAPRVSVVMPAFNAARFIGEAIASLHAQTFTDWELIVVDDGSDDDTVAVATRFGGPKCSVVRQPHRGPGPTRNSGLALARGEFVAHFDADDLWPADRLQVLVDALVDDPGTDMVFGMGVEFAEDDAPAGVVVDGEPRVVRITTAGLIRREAHQRCGGFSVTGSMEDQIDWTGKALALGLPYSSVEHLVLERRVHSSNSSIVKRSSTGRVSALRDVLALRRRLAAEGAPPHA